MDIDIENLESFLDCCNEGFSISDPNREDNPIIFVNKAFTEITGYEASEVVGKNCRFLQGDDRDQEAHIQLKEGIAQQKPVKVILRNYKKNGELFWNELSISPVHVNGQLKYYVGVQNDITQRVLQEKEIKDLNEELAASCVQDSLTKLYNRQYITRDYISIWNLAIRNKNKVGVIIMDVDDFKKYNDHYGHIQGDQCLVNIADAIRCQLKRKTDVAVRFGGEEFVIFLTNTEEKYVAKLAHQILGHIEQFAWPNQGLSEDGIVTLSAGTYVGIPEANDTIELFIQHADEALYQAKAQGRNQVCTFRPQERKTG